MKAICFLLLSSSIALAQSANMSEGWGPFLHIPGPNPILAPAAPPAWDSRILETSDAFEDRGTYYLYYHGAGGASYQLGVATAKHPLGPFTRHGDAPVLKVGPKGSWDDSAVACAMFLKEGEDRWLMWYSGMGSSEEHSHWSIGLATASSPVGPWTKHPQNPLLDDFGYVGGVVKVDGEYRLYVAHPIGSTGPDYSPMSLAVASKPEGPWTRYEGNPVLREGHAGEWDDGGFSEAEVLYSGGLYHMFYGGAKLAHPRILTRESIGYAWSTDGVQFTKYSANPVANLQTVPNAAAFAEVHAILEPPFIYLYHTLRYEQAWRPGDEERMPMVEDLGVQVLVMQRPFRLDMPVLSRQSLAARGRTSLADCATISLGPCETLTLTVQGDFDAEAQRGLRLDLRTSTDGERFDSVSFQSWKLDMASGKPWQATVSADAAVKFAKVVVTNLDDAAFANLRVLATLGG